MKMVATVRGQTHEIGEPSLSDLVAFERKYGMSAGELGEKIEPTDSPQEVERKLAKIRSQKVEYVAFMVYRALQRDGVFEKGMDFDAALDEIEALDNVPEPGDEDDEKEEPAPLERVGS